MPSEIKYLRLFLHSKKMGKQAIGHLSKFGDILRVSFDESYILDQSRSTLSLGFAGQNDQDTQKILRANSDVRLTRNDGRLPAYFQNLLPEAHNRDRLARQRGCAPEDDFELLAAAGHDLMGAVEVSPIPKGESVSDSVRLWHTALGLDIVSNAIVEAPVEDAASLPGVITKFSAVMDGRRYVVKRHGVAGSTILKLPSTRHLDLVQNEFTGFRLARSLGLECAEATIVSKSDVDLPEEIPFEQVLAVKRFDRGPDGQRIHMEEFAQILNYEPRHKYGKGIETDYVVMLKILDRLSNNPTKDTQEFVNRLVFFILMGNTDAHLKNWAVTYKNGITPELAPIYDPVCVTAFFKGVPAQDYALNRAIDHKVKELQWEGLEAILKAAGLLRAERKIAIAKELVLKAKDEWPEILKDAPDSVNESIAERLNGGVALAVPSLAATKRNRP
ncbi:MAG: HipA domain-containing protein [Polynucleobacter sp.]|uniref:type II toxin-antitoxin system HipA family toxin n=1 Tax=Polynucleobacter sp. TaxID=2029855 RepID=UPI002719824C|nr:HipA domain-containing protein [Polynucleobacter sp.]MDO8713992.1 HipA domain-containing protein [Polynucleobacter sp.]